MMGARCGNDLFAVLFPLVLRHVYKLVFKDSAEWDDRLATVILHPFKHLYNAYAESVRQISKSMHIERQLLLVGATDQQPKH